MDSHKKLWIFVLESETLYILVVSTNKTNAKANLKEVHCRTTTRVTKTSQNFPRALEKFSEN